MAYDSLGEFVEKLDAAGELKRIRVEVDPILEITAFADREMKAPAGGQALLFENCRGAKFPLLINAYGSHRRMALALGVAEVDDIARDLQGILTAKPPASRTSAPTSAAFFTGAPPRENVSSCCVSDRARRQAFSVSTR